MLLDGVPVPIMSQQSSRTSRSPTGTVFQMGACGLTLGPCNSASASLLSSSAEPKAHATYHHSHDSSRTSVKADEWSHTVPGSPAHVQYDDPFAPAAAVPMAKVPSVPVRTRPPHDLTTFKFPDRSIDMSTTDLPVPISSPPYQPGLPPIRSYPYHPRQQSTSP